MEFAGKAYIRNKKKLKIIQEQPLQQSMSKPISLAAIKQADLQSFQQAVEPAPRMRRQRSFQALSCASLQRDFQQDSQQQKELPQEYQDFVLQMQEQPPDRQIYNVKVDTNVVSLNLGTLEQQAKVSTGDANFCEACQAAVNCFSKLEPVDEYTFNWKCEFCLHPNTLMMNEQEIPTSESLDYMIMSQNQLIDSQAQLNEITKQISVIFCIDISGSMCVTEPITGKIQLKTKKQIDLGGFQDFAMQEQFLEGEMNLSYISRLECVQAAIEAQLASMAVSTPERKVGIVTFNGDVTIYGDGTTDPYILTGDRLNNFQGCLDTGASWESKMTHTIENTKDSLIQKLMSLQETGPTALGPALAASLGLASHGKEGSKLIICTDGLANIGVGQLQDPARFQQSENFYTQISEIAKQKGIEISVISIVGDQCKLSQLSRVSEITGGEVTRVNPENITSEFANILQVPVIATQVQVVVKLHKSLTFRYEENLRDANTLVKELGNVTSESEFTFEYSLRPDNELEALEIDLDSLKAVPFQTQIHYTNPQGIRIMRVISSLQDTADNLDDAAQNINFQVLGVNAAQRSAQLASKGEYREAQTVMRSWKRMMGRNARGTVQREQFQMYKGQMNEFNFNINNAINEEDVALGCMEPEMRNQARVQESKDALNHMAFRAKRANKAAKKECVIM